VIIYLAPTLLVLILAAVAGRVRHLIEPACPSCDGRRWHGAAGALACSGCGWTSAPAAAAFDARQLA
jgi:hypothetical protein